MPELKDLIAYGPTIVILALLELPLAHEPLEGGIDI